MSAFQVSKVFIFFMVLWPACLLMSSNCQISESVVETLDKEIHINIKRVDYINQTFCPAYLGMHYPSKFTPDSDVGKSAVESPAVNDEGSMYVEEISNTGKNDKTLSQLFNDLYKLATDEEYGTNAELNIMKETTIDNILAFAYREADKVLASTELEDGEDGVDEELVNKTEGGYIYPKLTRINPGKV